MSERVSSLAAQYKDSYSVQTYPTWKLFSIVSKDYHLSILPVKEVWANWRKLQLLALLVFVLRVEVVTWAWSHVSHTSSGAIKHRNRNHLVVRGWHVQLYMYPWWPPAIQGVTFLTQHSCQVKLVLKENLPCKFWPTLLNFGHFKQN